MRVYSKPNSNQEKEKLFQKHLFSHLGNFTHINETYLLSIEEVLNPFLDTRKIEFLLKNFDKLTANKKANVLRVLNQLPNKIRVAESNNLISVDFLLIDENNEKQYIEFHEIQHRSLSVNRLTPIFDEQFNRYEIPRYVQRFLKDVWRVENLKNYKIVWYDWFEGNPNFVVSELLNSDTKEFSVEGQFSFSKLISKNITPFLAGVPHRTFHEVP